MSDGAAISTNVHGLAYLTVYRLHPKCCMEFQRALDNNSARSCPAAARRITREYSQCNGNIACVNKYRCSGTPLYPAPVSPDPSNKSTRSSAASRSSLDCGTPGRVASQVYAKVLYASNSTSPVPRAATRNSDILSPGSSSSASISESDECCKPSRANSCCSSCSGGDLRRGLASVQVRLRAWHARNRQDRTRRHQSRTVHVSSTVRKLGKCRIQQKQ